VARFPALVPVKWPEYSSFSIVEIKLWLKKQR